MTGMLASVNSVEEAALVLSANVDIIDLKQPALGALGALETDLVKKIVAEIDGRCPVSATIGDLPMQPEIIFNAVKAMAETGVDYIKIGFFPDGDWLGTVEKLATFAHQSAHRYTHAFSIPSFRQGLPESSHMDVKLSASTSPRSSACKALPSMALDSGIHAGMTTFLDSTGLVYNDGRRSEGTMDLIAVLFADTQPDFAVIASLKNAGFKGVMLDTMDKKNGSLTQVMAKTDIEQFIRLAKTYQLICGLAGSLRLEDIPGLITYQPDYLGFRGALCLQHNRTAQLNKQSIIQIKQTIAK